MSARPEEAPFTREPGEPHVQNTEGLSFRFRSLDVTSEENVHLYGMSRLLLAEEYTPFHRDYIENSASNAELHEDILNKILMDKFSTLSRSRTKVSVNPFDRFAGTARFTRGNSRTQYPVESMKLFTPQEGSQWPHKIDGLSDDQIGEIGRVATMYEERKKGNTRAVLHSLMEESFKDAREHGIKQLYMVMPTADGKTQLRDHIIALGLQPEPIDDIRLRIEDRVVGDVVGTFINYWKLVPKVHRIHVPSAKAA